ncbi:MAG: hypothetical protein CW691_10420, partial [Candidatus Bathyarchaeum sp.]
SVASSPAVANGIVYIGSDDYKVYALNATDGTKIWEYTTGDYVSSSPAVANGIVYIGSDDYKVYALNATDGTKIWEYTTGSSVASSPAVANNVVYVGSYDFKVYALNATDGTKIWEYTTESSVISSPAVVNGIIYVSAGDHKVYALNATDGTKIWEYTTGSYVVSSPAVANDIVYVGSGDHKVYALNATDGTKIWEYTTGSNVFSSPAVVNGVMYVGSYDSKVYAFETDLTPKDVTFVASGLPAGTNWSVTFDGTTQSSTSNTITYSSVNLGTYDYTIESITNYASTPASGTITVAYSNVSQPIDFEFDWWTSFHHDQANTGYSTSTGPLTNQTSWTYTIGDIVTSSPAVADGVVYIGSWDNNIYAINANDGTKIWNYTTENNVFSSPTVVDGVVYVGSWDANVYALNATTGTKIWNYTTGNGVTSSPAVANGVVYIGSKDDKVYALNATTGTSIWNYTTGNDVTSSPAVANNIVYVGSNDYKLYALNATTGTQIWNYPTGGYVASAAVVDDVVYVGASVGLSGVVFALNATDGAFIWEYVLASGTESCPAVANGVLCIGSSDGHVFALNTTDGKQIWNYTKGTELHSSTAIVNGIVYVGAHDNILHALNLTDGLPIWSYLTDGYLWSSPAVADGKVFVGSVGGTVYAFGTPIPYDVTFTASGLPSGTSWSVTFDGTLKTSTTNTISFTASNGDYSYTVSTPSGYTSSSQLSGTITVAGANINKNIVFSKQSTPSYTPTYYSLTMYSIGNGTVTPGNKTYAAGTSVSLKALTTEGWTFAGWSGDATGTTNTTIVMNKNKVVNATFTQNEHTLTMLVVGEGAVTPTNGTYPPGTQVSLDASSAEGWTFSGWSGDATGTENTTLVMDSNKTVTATFTQDQQDPTEYTLTIYVVGNGTATPTNATYPAGTIVPLNATSAQGWTFAGWSGDATGLTNTTIVMNSDKTVTATFTDETIPEFSSMVLLVIFSMLIAAVGSTYKNKMGKQKTV